MSRQSTQEASARPKRQPLVHRQKLNVRNKEDGYHYRIVNANLDSDPDRVQDFIDAGWELVPKSHTEVGDKRVDNPSALGSVSQVSVGQGTKAVVMRIRKDWYEQDQSEKQKLVDGQEQTMKGDARKAADYGNLNVSVNTKE